MEALSNRGKLVIRNENFEAHYGKTTVVKTSKAHKKQKDETAARKPLGDLTNKSSFFPGISSKKVKATKQHLNGEDKEELNIREEGFLHDHSQCIKAQNTTSLSSFLDLVLPKCGSLILAETKEAEKAKLLVMELVELFALTD
ncbi:PATRONUS 2-like protein [Drosera capensis]